MVARWAVEEGSWPYIMQTPFQARGSFLRTVARVARDTGLKYLSTDLGAVT
jgi:hypothetical protein